MFSLIGSFIPKTQAQEWGSDDDSLIALLLPLAHTYSTEL